MGDIFEYYRARASEERHSSIPSSYQRRLESMLLHVILDQRESVLKCELRIHAPRPSFQTYGFSCLNVSLESMLLHVILDQRESLPKCELRIHAPYRHSRPTDSAA